MPKRGTRILMGGPDGSGKSSIAVRVRDVFKERGFTVNHLIFHPFWEIPSSSKPGEGNPNALASRIATEPRPWWGQAASVISRALEYWRATLRNGPLDRRSADLILHERGWLDQYVDPIRYRLTHIGGRFAYVIRGLLPRYDLIIVMVGDSSAIADRKHELPAAEIARQQDVWQSIRHRSMIYIDSTARTLDEALQVAMSAIEASMGCS